MSEALFTRFASVEPLAKVISKASDGGMVKKASAQLYAGAFETLSVSTTEPGTGQRLADMLTGWTPKQALSPSLSLGADAGRITTKRNQPTNSDAVTRDKAHFGYRHDVAGLLVLDYDPPKHAPALTPAELWAALLALWPEVADGVAVHWHSASSLIFDGDRQLSGIAGQRLYLVVQGQSDIPRALGVLNKRAWLKGIGAHVHVSASGALLPRSLFDSAMGDAGGRLDFAPAGAVCRDGLEQRRGAPTVFADGTPLDTRATLPDLSPAEEAEVCALIEAAKLRAQPAAEAKRAAWLADKQQGAAVDAVTKGTDPDEARARVKREHDALMGGVLTGSAELIHVDDQGVEAVVTVDQILIDPKRWHGKAFLSPHEPDHRGRSPDAMAYLLQTHPTLYDLNDSVSYRLQRQPVRLQVTQGNRAALADQIATELATYSDLMQCAGQLVRVVDGTFAPVSRPMLSFIAGTRAALYRYTKEGKALAVDADQPTIEMVHALLTERARKVIGRSSIPLIDKTGRVIDRPGLDQQTGIYLETESDAAPVPMTPTKAETATALRRLWKPWTLYDWTTEHDRAAMLATVLTVPLRPTIDAAPGLFADGAAQGCGKSAAIGAVMALVQGSRANIKSWTGDSEVELEKYLLSLARAGASAVAWDNVVSVFDSATIATAVVEGRISARQLGVTQALSPTFRAMWLASGNNGALGRDCGTRYMQARIASPDGQPHKKAFPFEPSEAARADRQGIVRAIITVHRAWHAAGCPQADGITTRFADWGRTVRQMVLWLSSSGLAEAAGVGALGDPADSILNRVDQSDPDTESAIALLVALKGKFSEMGGFFTAGDVCTLVRSGKDSFDDATRALQEAVASYFPRAVHGPSPQSVASLLKNRRDRVYAGLKLEVVPKGATREERRQGQLFMVVEA
jgi:hypothetical protein